jgi:hypothetical protein
MRIAPPLCQTKLNGASTASYYAVPIGDAGTDAPMIDNFALAVSHGLMLLAAWRLLSRPDLDDDSAPRSAKRGWFAKGGPDDA